VRTVNVERAARRCGISAEAEILDALAERSAKDIAALEDRRFLEEMMTEISREEQKAEVKEDYKKMRKEELLEHVAHLVVCARQDSKEVSDLKDALKREVFKTATLEGEVGFWRTMAREFSIQLMAFVARFGVAAATKSQGVEESCCKGTLHED
jgi:hypothetical protein